ncbi:MAG: accessory gene regulator B family protein [Ruminiclostridium sp.]
MEITFYRKLANKLADAVVGNQEYSAVDAKRIRYGLVCIFSDLYKFILFLIIFSIFSLTKEYLIAFTGILLLRPSLAGFHAKTELACVFISFTTMLISILLGNMNILPSHLQLLLIILLPIIGAIVAPVRKKKVEERKLVLKISACILTAVLLIIDYYLLTGQILFISVIQIYLLTLCQLLKNNIYIRKFP